MRKASTLIGTIAITIALLPGQAGAHAERSSSDPEAGGRAPRVPRRVTIEYTEPPAGEARARVIDGCKDQVADSVEIQGTTMTISLTGGEPGRWTVRTAVVSGLDGHPTRDSFSFAVAGRRDCSEPSPNDDGNDGIDEEDPPAGNASGENGGAEDDSFPIVPVALGTAGLVALAVAVRAMSSRS